MRFLSFVQTLSGSFSRRNSSLKQNDTLRTAMSVGLALTAVLCSATAANAQGVRLDPTIITYAGNGSLTNNNSGNTGLATAAGLNNPEGIAYDSKGLTYIADYGNNTIRTVNSAGIINAFAGTGAACTTVIAGADTACGDGGPASAATFNNPTQMQFDTLGNLYIADFDAQRIRKITATNGIITPSSIITTVAGTGTASVTGNTGLATAATLDGPHGLALDSANNLYIAEQEGCVVQYVPAANGNVIIGGTNTAVTAGHIYTIVGQANKCGYISDTNGTTQGTASELNASTGLALDASGNVYIGDYGNGRVRKWTRATGVITTLAGTGSGACPVNAPTTGAAPAATPACGDGGLATAATLNGPTGVYIDGSGNVIIGDAFGARVREINGTTKIISTLSGTSQQCTNISQTTTFADGTGNVLNFPNCGDGTAATKALVSFPILISVNPQGNILYVDQYDNKIREIVEHIVFANTNVGSSSATQNINLITTGPANTIITSITVPNDANGQPEFTLGTITGCTIGGTTGNVPGTDCTIPVTFNPAYAGPISQPLVAVTNGGVFQFGLTGVGVAPQAVLSPGQLSTAAGTGTAGTTGNGGQATAATLNTPRDISFDPTGNYYIGDLVSNEIRKVTPSGVISAFAGGGTTNYIATPGGAATAAALNFPTQAAFDAAGNAYIPDFNNHVVARVDAVTNAITVFAGTGVAGYSGDGGLATAAQLSGPAAVAVDQATGNVYIADPGVGATSNQTVRLVSVANGTISTVAGNGTTCASSTAACGDGGLATSAQLNEPNGLALDSNGNLYIADTLDNRIRLVNRETGNISTFAGTGTAAYSGDGGAAASAGLTTPFQIQLDAAGDLYIADRGNNAIRFVSPATGNISTIVGNGTACATVPSPACGDGGPANVSSLSAPDGVALDANGNIFVAEAATNRVRKVTTNPTVMPFPPAPAIGVTEGPLTASLVNIGNATLTFTTPTSPNSNAKVTTTSNPTTGTASPVSSNAFAQTSATTCGPIFSTSGATTLASGASCNYVVNFTPDTAVGNYAGTLVETDNSLYSGAGNTLYPTPLTQTINLTGSAVQGTVTILLGSSVNPSLVGQSVTLTATVSGGGVAPTGTVTFTYTPTGSTTPVTINAPATLTTTGGVTTATVTTSALPVGTDTVTATYNGDTNYVAGTKSSTLAQVVNQVNGTTTDKVTAASATITYGTSDQLTFSIPVVANAAVPAGTVVFTGGASNTALGSATWPATPTTGTCPSGTGTCYLLTDPAAPTNIPVGAPTTVTATYTATAASGYGSAAPTTTVTVSHAPLSNDSLTSAPTPTTSGTLVTATFFIPVSNGDAAPTGTVSFSSPGATFSTPTALTATTVNGVTGYAATATTSNLPVGSDIITGTLTNTDPNYAGGSLTTTETVNQFTSTNALTATPNPSTYGQNVTLTDTVTTQGGSPTGTVNFYQTGTTQVVNLQATSSSTTKSQTLSLPAGTYEVTILGANNGGLYNAWSPATPAAGNYTDRYGVELCATCATSIENLNGNPGYQTDTAAYTAFSGSPYLTNGTTAVGNPYVFTLTAPQSVSFYIPDGNFANGAFTDTSSFGDDSGGLSLGVTPLTQVGTGNLGANGNAANVATSTTPNLAVGTDKLIAVYGGDVTHVGSDSNLVPQVVNQAPLSNDTLTSSPTPTTTGSLVTATFFIPVPAGDAAPTGTVSFTSPNATFSTPTAFAATTINGVPGYASTATSTNLPVGTDIITGTLTNTDPNYAGGALTTNEVINQVGSTGEKVSAATASITYGTSDQLIYSIPVVANAAVPAGTVTFTAGTTALGSATWPGTPVTGTCPGGTGSCYLLTDSAAPTNIPVGAPTTVTGTFVAAAASGYASSAPTTTVTVAQAPLSADTISVSPNPATSGATVTVSFFIPVPSGDTPPTGPVTFTSPGATFSTPTAFTATTVNGVTGYVATATTTNLPTGTDTITGTYTTTDPNYAGGPLTTPETINPASGTYSTTASPSPTTVGSTTTLTFLIPVQTGVAAPSGTVAFTSGTTALGSATWPATPTITGGNYVLSTTTTALPLTVSPANSTPIAATFTASGTSGYATGTATTTDVVNQVPSTTDAVTTANANPTVGTGDALTYSIPVIAGVPVPAGTVTFTSGSTNLGTATWPAAPVTGTCPSGSGTCYLLVTNPAPTNIPQAVAPATTTPITATFVATSASGYASGAPTTTVTVAPAGGANDTVSASPTTVTFGSPDTLTFSIPVLPGVPVPTGTVVFSAPGVANLTGSPASWPVSPTISNGYYVLSISGTNLPVGSPTTVTATYTAGTGSGYSSASPFTTVTVNKVPVTNDSISASPTTITSGQTVTLTFTVPNVNSTAPANTSSVTFTTVINGATTTLGTAAVTGTTTAGVTTYTTTTTALPVGSDVVTGTFTGDSNYVGGALTTSVAVGPVTQTAFVTVANNPTTVATADPLTFEIPVTTGAAVPTGTVTFTSGSTALGSAMWPATPVTGPCPTGTTTGTCYLLADSPAPTNIPLTVGSGSTPISASFVAGTASGYGSTTAVTSVVVNPISSTGDAVTVTNNPSTVGAADPITFSIPVVTGAPVPSGSVAFTSGGTSLGTVAWPASPVTGPCPGGTGTCYLLADSPVPTNLPLPISPATTTPVTATFTATPSSGYASGSANTSVTVSAVMGNDTLTVATTPITYGTADQLTFGIPVSSGAPPPTGTVVFTAPGGITLGTATWTGTPTQSGGSYVISVSPTNIPVGAPTTVTATFTASTGSGYSSGAASATVTVTKVPTTNDSISANPSAVNSGQTVTLTFTVPNANSTAPATTATVTFSTVINGVTTTLGTGNLVGTTTNNVTTYTTTTTALPVGNDVVTGTFTGDTNYAGGALTTNVAVGPVTPTDFVVATNGTTTVGSADPLTFAIPIVTGAAVPTGTVAFASGSTSLGSATWTATPVTGACPTGTVGGNCYLLADNPAPTNIPLTPTGSTSTPVSATFTAGTASGYASATAVTSVVVNPVSGTDTLTAADSAPTVGQADALTFAIPVVTGAPVPTGSVSFTSGTTNLGSATWPATPVTGVCPSGSGQCYLLADNPAPTNIPLTVSPATSTPVTATYTAGAGSAYASSTASTKVDVMPVAPGAALTVATNPTIVGAADTLTFSVPVNAGVPVPAGTVVFTGGGVNLGMATWPANPTVVNGFYVLSISPTNIPLGNPTQLTATFTPSASSGYGASAPTATVVVSQIPGTGDTLTSNPNPSVFGNPVTFTETVPTVNGITPTGTVNFSYNGTQIGTGTLSNGVVTATTSVLPVGNDPVTATYSGDTNYATLTDSVTQVVGQANAPANLVAGPNPANFGQTVTLTETLSPINGICPPGPVTFFSNGTQIGTPATVNAQCVASITTSTLPVGSDAITATAPASGSFSAVTSGPVALVINKSPGPDTLASNPNPSAFGQNVTITDTIPTVGGVAPTGTVNFYDFGTLIGTGTVSPTGVATLVTSALPVGTDSLTAVYQGDGNYAQVTAGPVNQTVTQVSGNNPTLAAGPNPTTFGTLVTITETIPTVNGTPATGTVIFSQNGTVIGTGTINAQGIASFQTSTLPVGTDQITSTYAGDTNYAAINLGPVAEVVNKGTPADTLAVNPDPSPFGNTVTITDTVPTVGGVAPTGTVTFTNNGTTIGTAPIVNGVATLTTTALPVGSDPISGAYSGDNNYAPMTAGPVNEIITTQGTAPVLGATPNPTTFGTQVTLTLSIPGINGVTPTGSVQFFDNGTAIGTGTVNAQGVATLLTTTLPIGTDPITATYSGDTNYAGSTTPKALNVVVNLAAPTDTLTSAPTPTTFGTAVTETFTVPLVNGVVPTGLVSFYDGTTLIGTANVNASGVATLTTSNLPVGTDTITAKYPGDNTYAPASPTATEVVGLAPGTGDTLATVPNPSIFGNNVTITETLPTVGGVAPTGTVTFYNNGAQIGTGTVTNGVATLIISTLPPGTDPITATYSGDGNYATVNSGPVQQNVKNVNGASTLTANPNPSTFGVPVTLTEAIAPVNGLCPNGPATFLDGGTTLGNGAVTQVNGQCVATLTTSTLPVGADMITATVPASNGFGVTNTGPITVNIGKALGTGDTLSTSPNPSTFGQTVTLTEVLPSVNGVAPTGTVVFTYNGTTLGTGTVSNGIAMVSTSTLPPGSDPITATYSGDATFATVTSGPVTQVVNAGKTNAVLAVGPNPSTFGTPVTLTETIAPINGVCPVGPATFLNNGTSIGTGVISLTNGACVASITTSTLPVGSDSLTVTVPGDSTFSPITSGPVALVVNKANGPDTLAANPNPSTFGNNVTLTDTIPTVGGIAPTGTVNFYDFGTLIGTGTVTNGVATLVTGTLPVGTDSITATYLGDPNYAQVTAGPVNEVVSPIAIVPTLAVGPNPTTFGTPVTVTETMPIVNNIPPTGTVTFLSNGNVIGTGTINAQGVASFTTSTLPVGTDSITATYPGNTNYSPVTSGPVAELVNKANGPDTLTVNPDPGTFGAPVVLTDTIPTVGGVVPTGTVSFYDNGTLIGTGTVNAQGVATLTTGTLPVGTDPITAVYSGDPNYASVTSGPVNETVVATSPLPVLGATPNPTTFGTTVTLTESIPGVNGVTPTGTVNFYDNGTLIGTGTLKNGVATLTSSTLPIGTDPITATYSGDSNYSATNSGPLNVVIGPATPIDTLTSGPAGPTLGQPVTLTFTVPIVNGVVPTGVVTFYNGTTVIGTGTINSQGIATLTTSTLPAGSTTITAKYPGDNTYAPASPTTTVTVGPGTPVSTVTTNVPTGTTPGCGTSVTLTDTITQINGTTVSGTVQFYDNGTAIGSPVNVSAGGVATFTTTTLPCGATSTITAVFTPTPGSPYTTSTSAPITLPVSAPDFAISASPANQVVNPGDSATYTVSLSGVTVPFNSPVTLTATCNCQGITFSFANPTVTPGQGPNTTTMTLVTSPTFAMSKPAHGTNNIFYGLLLLPLLGLGGVRRKLRKLPKGVSYCLAALLLLGGMGAVTGCGGGYYGPPVKVCTVTITGTSGNITHSTTVNVTVR